MNTPDPNADWLDMVESRRLSPAEVAALRQGLARRPRELARLAEELALNSALDSLPTAEVPSNFSARIWADIDRAPRTSNFRWPEWFAICRPARALTFATVLVAAGLGWGQFQAHQRGVLAANVSEVSQTVPELELLRDFDAIRALHTTPKPGDVELMGALAQQ